MKNLKYFALFAFIAILFVSCSDDDGGVQAPIDIPTTAENVEIPFVSVEGVKIAGPIDVKLNVDFDEVVKDNTAGILGLDNVKAAVLQEFTIELDDTSFLGDFSAIKDADIYVKAKNPDVQETKVAQVRGNTNKEKIVFDVITQENLIDYFKADDTYVVLRNIVPGDNSLTKFTTTVKPVWKFSFGL